MKLRLLSDRNCVDVATLMPGVCFRRPESKDYHKYLYMRVDILTALRWESKDDCRNIPVINLGTGAVWCLSPTEQVITCPDAVVLEKP